jgi:hypothetical protein
MIEHRRNIDWEWLEEPGLEHLTIEESEKIIRIESSVVSGFGGLPWHLRYQMTCTPLWQFMSIDVEMKRPGEHRSLSLVRRDDGAWSMDGQARLDLAHCTDIDIEASPLTNTLPIRRLESAVNEPKQIQVTYIRGPSLEVLAANQEYTRLDPENPPGKFRLRSLSSGFTADLTVDESGIVEDYPNLWRRLL